MNRTRKLAMNLQLFADPFTPNNVTMQDAKTGAIPVEIADSIITGIKNGSAITKLAKAIPMDKPEKEFTFMSGVGAYWVDEAQIIQTTKPTFTKAKMTSKKLAVIIPTSKENLRYSITDFFTLMKPEVMEAFYKKFDQAGFSGVGSPFAWNVLKSATDSAHTTVETANKYDDINTALGFIETEDLDANGIATIRSQKRKYRATKDENGLPIFNSANSNKVDDVLGLPIAYTEKTALGNDTIAELVGNWDYAYYGIPQGIEYTILTEATLSTIVDADGKALNLAEKDMVALKATMQIGFMIVKDKAFAAVTKAPAGV